MIKHFITASVFFFIIDLTFGANTLEAGTSISNNLDHMYSTLVQDPTKFKTDTRNSYQFGRAQIRFGQKNFNVVSWQPPSIRAGCGGVDLIGGSFSVMNKQQWVMILRQVAQNALAYMFELAIKQMCESCWSVLARIQKAIQHLNAGLKNTCQLAKGIVTAPMDSDNKFWKPGVRNEINQIQNNYTDWEQASEIFADVFSSSDTREGAGDESSTVDGNPVLKKIKKNPLPLSALKEIVPELALNDPKEGPKIGAELVASFFGIMTTYISSENATAEQKAKAKDYSNTPYVPQLTFADIGDSLKTKTDGTDNYWYCVGNSCAEYESGPWEFKGTIYSASQTIFGHEEACHSSKHITRDNGIFKYIYSKSVTHKMGSLSSELMGILSISGVFDVTHLKHIQFGEFTYVSEYMENVCEGASLNMQQAIADELITFFTQLGSGDNDAALEYSKSQMELFNRFVEDKDIHEIFVRKRIKELRAKNNDIYRMMRSK
jgi:hypothetical protein